MVRLDVCVVHSQLAPDSRAPLCRASMTGSSLFVSEFEKLCLDIIGNEKLTAVGTLHISSANGQGES
eukprot:2844330-Amphidinium_carterae.1